MKRLLVLLPYLLLASACIRVEQKLALNPDSSGTFEVTYTVPDETTQRMKSMLKLADELAVAGGEEVPPIPDDDFTRLVFDPQEDAIRQRIASYERFGIRLDELEFDARNARRQVKIVVAFSNIADVAKADFFASYGFSVAKNKAGQYVWYTRPLTREALDQSWAGADQDAYKLMAPLLSGFHYELRVQTPGRIINSNADQKDPYVAQWLFAFDANPQALADLQRKQMTIVFDNTGLVYPEFRQPEARSAAAPPPSPPAVMPPTNSPAVTLAAP